jgi:long-subunit fatty acid transport protein
MKRIVFFMLLGIATSGKSQQHDKLSMGIQLQAAIPTGSFNSNLVNSSTFRGASLDVLYRIAPQWKIGGAVQYQDFYQKNPRALYNLGDGSLVSGVLSNSIQTIPLMIKGMWLPMGESESAWKPFVQAGAGVNFIQYEQLLGRFTAQNNNTTKMAFQLGGGMLYDIGKRKNISAMLSAQYHIMPFNKLNTPNLNHLGIGIGVRFKLKNDGGDYYVPNQQNRLNRRGGRW